MNLEKIPVKNKKLLEEALTHKSYAYENNVKDYERLEFLGDAVLELIISEYLYKKYNIEEGALTKKRAELVCEEALSSYAFKLGLNDLIKLGNGEEEGGGRTKKTIVADIFEAILGAIYIDGGYDVAKNFIYSNIIDLIEKNDYEKLIDYKSTLQELVQTDRKNLKYEVKKEIGPAHDKTYEIIVKIDDIIYGRGIAKSKKDAEQKAARDALSKSIKKGD